MSTELLQLYSQNHWLADGVQTVWNFTFADGYISEAYVKAYYLDGLDNKTEVFGTLTGEFQLTVDPPVPADMRFVILRDTPKDAPLVNFSDGARVSEVSLDTIARQATHIAAEVMDGSGQTILLDEYGFKSMKRIVYTGASVVLVADNGRAHFKTDATGVTLPDTLPDDFLSTIVNYNAGTMNVLFTDAVAVLQGDADTAGKDTWVLDPNNSLTVYKAGTGMWFISGSAT